MSISVSLLTCLVGGAVNHERVIVAHPHCLLALDKGAPVRLNLICIVVDGVPLAHVHLVAGLGLPALHKVLHHLFQRVGSMILRLTTEVLEVGLKKNSLQFGREFMQPRNFNPTLVQY